MIQIALIVLFGISILYVAARLLLESGGESERFPTIDDFSQARSELDGVFERAAAVRQIFSRDDLEYATNNYGPDVVRLFLRQRKRVAIAWLQRTQKLVTHLFDLHLKLAKCTYEPNEKTEIKLMLQYILFLLLSHGAIVYIRVGGPFALAAAGDFTLRWSENFFTIFSLRFADVDPVRLRVLHDLRTM
jgi:hypothetical protein